MTFETAKQILAGYAAVRGNEIDAINTIIAKCDDALNQIKIEVETETVSAKARVAEIQSQLDAANATIATLSPSLNEPII